MISNMSGIFVEKCDNSLLNEDVYRISLNVTLFSPKSKPDSKTRQIFFACPC